MTGKEYDNYADVQKWMNKAEDLRWLTTTLLRKHKKENFKFIVIMDSYEKKYKEALNKAKDMLSHKEIRREDMEYLFPELKESEDEKIRKALLNTVKYYHFKESPYMFDISKEQVIAWLEKQKEFVSADFDDVWETADCDELTAPLEKYSKDAIKKMCHAWYDKGIELERRNWLEKQGTQPRYNIGDIICDKSCTTLNKEAQPNMEIVDIQNGMYICDKGSFPVSQQDEYELVSKKIDTKLNDNSVSNELREASFAHAESEMKNQTFPDNLEFELIYTFEEGAKWEAAQKPTWSEEDEVILDEIIDFFENGTVKLQYDLSLYASWLKSLKDRVKTQQEWTMQDEEELQIALDTLVKAGQHSSAKWLKNVCLVPQNKWKPSDEHKSCTTDE